jgi:hypothetical protein
VPAFAKRYLALIRRRKAFLLGLLLLLALGALGKIAAHTDLILPTGYIAVRELLATTGDALIVAAVLALLVDPIAQHQFATEWGRDLYWAIFSPNAPDAFREALQELAAPAGYIEHCSYEVELAYPESGPRDHLDMCWRVTIAGINLERRGFTPTESVFLVARHDGGRSRYTEWSFRSEGGSRVSFDASEIAALPAMSTDPSGRTVLDQSKLPGVPRVPFGLHYWAERRFVTSRWLTDYVPLFQRQICLAQDIAIRGDAVRDLDVTVTKLGGDSISLVNEKRADGKIQLRAKLDDVSFPGSSKLIGVEASAGSPGCCAACS